MYGSGGTFTALAAMSMAAKSSPPAAMLRGSRVSRAEVKHLLDHLRELPVKDRAAVPGLSPDRADIIVAGLAIVDRVMRRLKVNVLEVHNRGVRDGLLLTVIDAMLGFERPSQVDREAAVDELAERCGVDPAHSQQVARLAGQMFRQLAGPCSLDPQDGPLLEAAARLCDVGHLIDYDQHHKHSYHLIVNSRLSGFEPRELELVANVARYHRGARPKAKHDHFARLAPAVRDRVRRLAGILRIAGALDRSHSQSIEEVRVRECPGGFELTALAPQLPQVDLWQARHSVGLFERAFDCGLHIQWQSQNHRPFSADGRSLPTERGTRRARAR
jgi:exopolyphosphatase/guanosine-5'-triphosphate,3'-diphosphate pyrophosphatase